MDTAILITRENIICSELTKEQFVNMMSEDLTNALHEDVRIFKPIAEEYHKQCIERDRERVIKRATEFAERKWKTEKKRKAYIESEIEKLTDKPLYFSPVSYFDFDAEPWKNGISGCCILHPCETVEHLERCFEYIKDNVYFKAAKGWQLIDHRNSRPEIKLILDEEMETKYKNDERGLSEAIARFYEGSNYWGD